MTLSAPQIGKTLAVSAWLLAFGWEHPGRLLWWAAPTYRQVAPGFDSMKALAQSSGALASATGTRGGMKIRLVNGAVIDFVSWEEPENLSGPTVSALVIDEAHGLSAEAWKVLRARLSSTLGPVRAIGNTGDIEGAFKTLCDEAEDPANADFMSFHRWTWGDKLEALGGEATEEGARYAAFIADERRSMLPSDFEAIYEARWQQNIAGVFSNVDQATSLLASAEPEPGASYVIGWDVGETEDFFVGVPMRVGGPPAVRHLFRWRGLEGPDSVERMLGIGEAWNNALHVVEINGQGRYIFQQLRRRGARCYPWTTLATSSGVNKKTGAPQPSKGDAVSQAAGDLHWGRLALAPLPPLQSELKAYRRERMPSGIWRYEAREGAHDDTVMALVIANSSRLIAQAYNQKAQRVRIS